jgi:hypothetical protein
LIRRRRRSASIVMLLPREENANRRLANWGGMQWMEPEGFLSDLQTGVAALHDVGRAGHGPQMDAWARGSSLPFGHIGC